MNMKRKSKVESRHQSGYISSFARSLHEQESLETSNDEEINWQDNFERKSDRVESLAEQDNSSTSQQLKQKKQNILKTLDSRERKILQKVEKKIGRPLNDLEQIDAIDRIIYEPERIISWLEEVEKESTTAESVATPAPEDREDKIHSKPEAIAALSSSGKIAKAIEQAIIDLPVEDGNKLKALLSSRTLAVATSILGIWATSHFLVVGEIVDIVIALFGGAFLGWNAIALSKDLIGFANAVNAVTEQDIDRSAQHLVKVISLTETDSILSLLTNNKTKRL